MPAQSPQSLSDASHCFACLGISSADAFMLAEWDIISQNIGGGGGGNELLAEDGSILMDETGASLLIE